MKPLCVMWAALLLAASAQARLGETEDQIAARFGAPYRNVGSPPASCQRYYKVPGFIVRVTFESGVSVEEIYGSNAPDGQSLGSARFKLEDAEAIVFKNGGRSAWHRDEKSDTNKFVVYRREDGGCAMIHRDGTGVAVCGPRKETASSDSLKKF